MKFIKMKINNEVAENTLMMYIYTFVKIIFPLIVLPYLTRVLSVSVYGMVNFVKSYMIYIQLFVDYGFILSSVKDIVNAEHNKEIIGQIVGQTICAKIILSILSFFFTLIMISLISILKDNFIFVIISLFTVYISSYLLDFLFRGIEQMKIFVISFVIMKILSTTLTFLLVKNDSNVLLIPILDLFGSVVAVIFTLNKVRKMGFVIHFSGIKKSINMIKESSTYFFSNIATTAFGAFNTILIGIIMKNDQVAIWSVALYIISAINTLYAPIANGIYPNMIRTKSLKFIKKILWLFMPIVLIGSALLVFLSDFIILLVAGEKYLEASLILKLLTPVIIFSLPSVIFGWPSLGVIGKEREVMKTTIITAALQVLVLLLMAYFDIISLVVVALTRSITEMLMLIMRTGYVIKYRNKFAK